MLYSKQLLLLTVFVVGSITCLQAQISAGAGLALIAEQRLQVTLQQAQYFGTDFTFTGPGVLLQAAGMAPYQEVLLGAKITKTLPQLAATDKGSAQVQAKAAFFEIGLPLGNNPNWQLYPYAGLGIQQTTLTLYNLSNYTMVFSSQYALPMGGSGTFSATGFSLDGGLAFRSRVGNAALGKRHFLFGFDMGTFGLPKLQNWKLSSTKESIHTLAGTHNQNFYLSLLIGYELGIQP